MSVPSNQLMVSSADGTTIAYQTLGAGEGVIVVGGALRASRDYLSLARTMARSLTVHVVDRRGRGASGPQGAGYRIETECEDLLAVHAETKATAVFGHSYGGLVALEAARRTRVFSRVAVYEPAVSIHGSIPVDWMPRYRQLLAAGDTRGAFACMVRRMGFAPKPLSKMPLWYVKAILRVVMRGPEWRRMEPLLESNLAEHEEVARLDDGTVDRYRSIAARVLILGGQKSPAFTTTKPFNLLHESIADSTVEILDGFDHNAPDDKAPQVVGKKVRDFLCSAS